MAVLMLSGCNRESAPDCFKSAGENKTVKRNLDDFHSIELRDFIKIELVDSNAYFVEITAPANLIPKVSTEVEDGVLVVTNENTCNFVRSFKKTVTVRIYAPSFPDIQNFSTGDITSVNTISSPYFRIENHHAAGTIKLKLDVDSVDVFSHTGVCDVLLEGNVFRAYLFEQGLGFIDARNLNCQQAFVNNSSINDVYIRATDYLFAFIQFSGNVYYNGSPSHIDKDIEGQGQLIRLQ